MRMRKPGIAFLFIITIFGLFTFTTNTTAMTSPEHHTSLYLQWTQDSEKYSGVVIAMSDTLKLDRVRISIYDMNEKIRETGLLSEYSENNEFGKYLEFKDTNNNGKLDAADIFIIPQKGVSENWGIVFTYEPSGTELASRTLSNKEFPLKENEKEYDPTIYILIFDIHLISLFLILVYIYTRKN